MKRKTKIYRTTALAKPIHSLLAKKMCHLFKLHFSEVEFFKIPVSRSKWFAKAVFESLLSLHILNHEQQQQQVDENQK